MNRRTLALAAGTLMLAAPGARADTVITDFLDRIGGCRKPMHDSFSYEISPYTAKPYGKALADWTDQDVADFRAYFVACQARRPDWPSMGDYNRNHEIQAIDTAMAELRDNVERARAEAGKQRADAAYEAEKRRRAEEQRQAEATAATQRAEAEGVAQAERRGRNEVIRQKVVSFLEELLAFTQNELEALPPEQKLVRLDGYLTRMQALAGEAGDAPVAKPLLTMLEQTRALRAQTATEQSRQATPSRAAPTAGDQANADAGPYTDFEWLGQQLIVALTNPLQRESFRASLGRGIDFNVGVSAIEPAPTGWLVQLSGRLGVTGTPGQGFFCRVAASDNASLAVLRTVTPPFGIIHVAAPDADEFILESRPLHIRIVFDDCRITPLDNGSRRSGSSATRGNTAPGSGASGDAAGTGPVAPSPPNLRCQTNPPRREHERVMAHRLRQVWAIPEALRDDPTLSLTFAVKLNFDAELTGPVELQRSGSQRATPEQLRAAAEAGRQAILASAPFPELGQFAGGTMQIDMTPCD